jgi:hypothetical protein
MSARFVKCFSTQLKDLGLTTWNEINILSAILDQFDLKAKATKSTPTELEMSTTWLSHLLLDLISTAVIERALQTFAKLSLLTYRRAKNRVGKTVRWISIINDQLSILIFSESQINTARQTLTKQAVATTKSKKMWQHYNQSEGVFERMATLDSQSPSNKLFAWAFDHISQRSVGTRYEWTTGEVGKLMHNGLWDTIKQGYFDFAELEAYGKWKTKTNEAPTIREFLRWKDNATNRQYIGTMTTYDVVAKQMRKDPQSYWFVGDVA